ncbi:MAG: TIGR02646 family protein [Planctomycetaceae bacterium]|jgi:uncharacterized protein (TIGR02646 family)|nr:TIGR02646 family protein [Planctomycetaceae bacterium]
MKYIVKNNNKNIQNLFKRWQERGGWNADEFDNKAKKLKQKIKNSLLTEQGEICCYCEERITIHNSHLEHLKPKGKAEFAYLISNYENILCSCNNTRSCGKKKGENVIPISPLDENCEDLFTYSDHGKIIGENQNANDTIRILNLDSEHFNSARRQIIETFIGVLDNVADISLSEFDNWTTDYLTQKPFVRYWTTVKWTSKKYRTFFE